MSVSEAHGGLLAPEHGDEQQREGEQRAIVELLTRAYWMEIETVMHYIAASTNQEGACGVAVSAALTRGAEEEVEHARRLGRRVGELHGVFPGDQGLAADADYPQTPGRQPDVGTMIESVLATETSAIRHYSRIMRATAKIDRDTNALALEILRDEQRHLRLFEGYLRAYRRRG